MKYTSVIAMIVCTLCLMWIGCNSYLQTHNIDKVDPPYSDSTYVSLKKRTDLLIAQIEAIQDSAYQLNALRDYQIIIVEDSLLIYDGRRFVGHIVANWDNPTPIDSLIMEDNR